LREKKCVQVHLLLGPAGSGKTFRCLAEVRAGLRASPEGPPLILLAPKQATFQLERQLLASGELSGYTRLNIFSFERLARFVLAAPGLPLPAGLLSEEGRAMVLRALLRRHERELKLFGSSARRPGFARQLGQLLDELQQHQYTPARLRDLSQRADRDRELQHKLHDLALLLDAYRHWLAGHALQDASYLLDAATESLKSQAQSPRPAGQPGVLPPSIVHLPSSLPIAGLWMDGFAEMTPQELDLLAGILPHCQRATLAFCLAEEPEADASLLSPWSTIGKTVQQCRRRIGNLPDCEVSVESLARKSPNRFSNCPALRHLESNWATPRPIPDAGFRTPISSVRMVACTDAAGEATLAAREILRFVQQGGRFRDCAVLVRNLDSHYQPLARVFRRYGVPFFLDRRESVAHHPLAELTRSALRTVAFDWQHDDWFAALKAGFSTANETGIDRLENAALEFGWRGRKWLAPISVPEKPELENFAEPLRKEILPPFENFATRLARHDHRPTGGQLAEAVRDLWKELHVDETLAQWSLAEPDCSALRAPSTLRSSATAEDGHPAIHLTVREQMNAWLDNVALAFPDEALSLREWLPVLEAGLAGLTVGVIPPALDQVLVGAVDRARNPDLKLALVLGANESLFPAAPAAPAILTDADRAELGQTAVALGPGRRERLARERYLGYIACTRASDKLIVTFARHGVDGKRLNPSPFIAHLRRILPGLEIEQFNGEIKPAEAAHASEMTAWLAQTPAPLPGPVFSSGWSELLELPAAKALTERLRAMREPELTEGLSHVPAERLFGPALRSSVSRLEEFAQCPFRFFVHSGLRAEERKVLELDAREQGSFQHEVLKRFHEQLPPGRRWRDLTPAEARDRIGRIATGLAPDYSHGLLRADALNEFIARMLTEALQDFVERLVAWMRTQYEFDPAAAELEFGISPGGAPAWELDLGNGHQLALHGRIDRIDLCRETGDHALAVVMDYKSSRRKLDPLLVAHGIQLQLLVYLAAVARWPDPRKLFGVASLKPAGAFYVNLRGQYEHGATRTEALADPDAARKRAYRHAGRFDVGALPWLDRAGAADQFNYRLNKDGRLRSDSVEALPPAEFAGLLDRVEVRLREMGRAIFSGAVPVAPYRKGSETPCEFCDYRAVCRIDPWTHRYRVLRAAEPSSSSSSSCS
jgi:ATP-dependent helicase/nuclease subunit B